MRNQTRSFRHFMTRSRLFWIYVDTENGCLHPSALVTLDYFLTIYNVLELIFGYIETYLRLFEYLPSYL